MLRIYLNSLNFDSNDSSVSYDPQELEEITRLLHDELSELKYVDSIEYTKNNDATIPEGSKGIEGIMEVGSLLVTLATSSGVLEGITGTIQSWMQRTGQQKITMEINGDKIEITGITSENQDKLVEAWINKHK
jgi:hypothetical protein